MYENEPFAMLQKAWQISTRQAGLPAVEQRFQSAAGLALTRPARVVLTLLSEKGPLHVSDLAAAAGVDVSTMSRTLRHLGESGFVSREPGEDLPGPSASRSPVRGGGRHQVVGGRSTDP